MAEPVAFATMHAKERALGPVLAELGFELIVPEGVDTDRFGTFTGDIARAGSQLEAARAKAELGLKLVPDARWALASEGAFGPHPRMPFVTGGVELVLLRERDSGRELQGWDVTAETNAAEETVASWAEAEAFAQRVGFPEHGLVVSRASGAPLRKGVVGWDALRGVLAPLLAAEGSATLGADMRAHVNPTRMRSIERAGRDLAAAWRSACPVCAAPGFVIVDQVTGLPCEECGGPTLELAAEVRACSACGERRTEARSGYGSPSWCEWCNP